MPNVPGLRRCGPGPWKGAPAGLIGADMTPKPAYQELMKLVKEEWWTELDAKTDPTGSASFRGFLGDYEIEVTADSLKPMRFPVTLIKREANHFDIKLP